MKNSITLFSLFLCISCGQNQEKTVYIDSAKIVNTATDRLNGANVEDLNFQCYGGMYSQLLYGQDFEIKWLKDSATYSV
jgi:hypothetical protein